jgi:hypothetical protein
MTKNNELYLPKLSCHRSEVRMEGRGEERGQDGKIKGIGKEYEKKEGKG